VPLRPAEVHPQEHLRPVGRLGPAGPRADREHGIPVVVLAAEEERRPQAGELSRERVELGREVRLQPPVPGRPVAGLRREVVQLGKIARSPLQVAPSRELVAQLLGLLQDTLSRLGIVPEAGLGRLLVEDPESLVLAGEVKDAPRSRARGPRGRARVRRPSAARSQVLQEDRAEFDQAQGRLASSDDGVDTGTVGVVRARAAVAVAVQAGRIAAPAAVALTGDQIEETFLGDVGSHPSLTASIHRSGAPGTRRGGKRNTGARPPAFTASI